MARPGDTDQGDHRGSDQGGDPGGGAVIAALTADLMFAARIRGAAPAAAAVQSLAKLSEVAGPSTRLVLVDLQAREAVAAVERVRAWAPGARVVAFGPHVAEEALAEARSAGADQVMTRGAFVRGLTELVRGAGGG
jgi:DNA-binding NarL/FixJ family response regulator